MTRRRTIALGAGLAATGAMLRRRSTRVPTDPFDPDAIRAETAAARTAEIVGRPRVRRVDLAQTYAPAIATAVDPLLHGRRYFPRMLDDIAAATDHVHLLIYGYKAGDIGETFLTALADRVAAGVEVRLSVDAIGSEVDFGSKDLFRRLLAAGVEVVAQDGIAVIRTGDLADRSFRPRGEDLLHFDHRKMAVIDGRVGYVGGSGIEDHYNDERFYDVMCRVEGPIVAQLQSVFLLSWRHHDGPAPADPALDRYFPIETLRVAPDAAFQAPTTVLWNVPGTGHHPISDAIETALEDAAEQIHIVNPYISNRAILERILAAALRGVRVRLIAPGKPTPPYPAAAFRHWYGRLLDAGAEILLHPQMAHAKVLRIDDQVFVGGCNLDDLSLFRNDELDLLFADPAVAELTEHSIFDELSGMSTPAVASTNPRARAWNATMDRVSRFL
jgi:cardiolipin synthase